MKIQEMIDAVYRHLLTQNKRALSNERCAYRGDDGCKCAAGCLIPPEKYLPTMEGRVVARMIYFKNLAKTSEDSKIFMDLLGSFQSIHDTEAVRSWKEHLETVILSNGYSIPDMLPAVST